jgi:Replication-relaxation
MITERDIQVLAALARFYVLTRPQVQHLVFPNDCEGRITRRRLQLLVDEHLINRTQMQVIRHAAGAPAPVYYPSRKGCEFLAEHFDDNRFLSVSTQTPHPHYLLHWIAISDTHIALHDAIARQEEVRLDGWINEWDTVNKDAQAPEKRYRLFTLIRETPRLVAAPDAAFLLSLRGHKKVFYLEQDRNTSGVYQVAAGKTPGYAAMAEQGLHRRHFPEATIDSFLVLLVAPTPRRRDALRKAIAGKPGSWLWRFASATELTAETFLQGTVFYPCEGEAASLIKPMAGGPA